LLALRVRVPTEVAIAKYTNRHEGVAPGAIGTWGMRQLETQHDDRGGHQGVERQVSGNDVLEPLRVNVSEVELLAAARLDRQVGGPTRHPAATTAVRMNRLRRRNWGRNFIALC